MQLKSVALLVSAILLANILFAQIDDFELLNPDSLIKKNKVKTIISATYDEPNSTKISWLEIWKFDTAGKLIYHHLIDKDSSDIDDSGFCGEYYFYKDNKLIQEWDIGLWNMKTMKIDTVVAHYYYNDKNKLIKTISKGPLRDQNYTETFEYKVNYELNTTTEKDGFHYTDSIIFGNNGKVELYFEKLINMLCEYKYNKNRQIIEYRVSWMSDTSSVSEIKNYYYTNGLLAKKTDIRADPFEKTKNVFLKKEGSLYYYDKKGLLKEERRMDDNVMTERYSYEYY